MNSITITNYKPYQKGALAAFFTVTLPSGLLIHNCKLFSKESGNRWVGLPQEKFTDRNGVEGYRPIVSFSSREACDGFRDAVLRAIDGMSGVAKTAQRASGPPKAEIPIDDSDIPF